MLGGELYNRFRLYPRKGWDLILECLNFIKSQLRKNTTNFLGSLARGITIISTKYANLMHFHKIRRKGLKKTGEIGENRGKEGKEK